jgi:hypothetical protein
VLFELVGFPPSSKGPPRLKWEKGEGGTGARMGSAADWLCGLNHFLSLSRTTGLQS